MRHTFARALAMLSAVALVAVAPLSAAPMPTAAPGAPAAAATHPCDPVADLACLREYLAEMRNAPDIDRLIAQLGDESFEVRQRAQDRLMVIRDRARPALEKARGHADPEIAWRAATILNSDESDHAAQARLHRLRQVRAAAQALAAARNPDAWPLLLDLVRLAPPGLRDQAAESAGRYGPARLADLDKALAAKSLTESGAVAILAAMPDAGPALARPDAPAALRALAPRVEALLKDASGRKKAWTTGKIDRHTFGGKSHTYETPPMGTMVQPVVSVVYGFWGGRGEGDGDGAPTFTIHVNGVQVGDIDNKYSGYISPGPKIKTFALDQVGRGGVFTIVIKGHNGGESVIGEVKVWDRTGEDPGVITRFDPAMDKGDVPQPRAAH